MTRNIQYKKLGEICDFISGGTPSKSKNEYWKNGNIPWIKISDFKDKYIKFSEEKITKIGLENSSAKILKKGTILYTIFASVGKVAILDIEATTNQAIVGINLKEDNSIDKDFLYYFLSSIENNIKKQARGVAQNNINISILKNINIPILPMSFQKNIVKTLNKLENILENFKQKKLLINFLNKSLFKKYSNHRDSHILCIKDISSELFAGGDKPTDYSEKINGEYIYPVYSNGEKREGLLCFSKIFKVAKEGLTISARGTIGFTTIRKPYFTPVVRLITLIPNENNNINYLKYAINSLNLKASGSGVAQLTVPIFSKYKLNLPPLEVQNKFAERIEKIEKLKFIFGSSLISTTFKNSYKRVSA